MFSIQRIACLSFAAVMSLSGCSGSGGGVASAVAPAPNPPPVVQPNAVTSLPVASTALLTNPFHGFVRYVGVAPPVSTLPQTLAYNNLTWKTLEPIAKGTFNWAAFEAGWAQETARGRRIGFRLNMSFPNATAHDDVPAWLIAAGVPVTAYNNAGSFGSVPDWNNATFLAEHDRMIAALGARYNLDPRIAWVDVGSYGIWGEWHQFGAVPALPVPTAATKKRLLDAYLLAFPNKRLVLPYGDAYATQYLTANGKGLRNDCLGPVASNTAYYNLTNPIPTAASGVLYKTAPVTGEFCNGSVGVASSMTTDYATTLAFIQNTHWSWIGPTGWELLNPTAAPLTSTVSLANIQQLHRTLGYRFRVASVSHLPTITRNTAATINAQIQNNGVAPFYEAWPVELSLINAAGVVSWSSTIPAWNVRTWLPGASNVSTSITIPATLPAGTYTLAIAILDPAPIPPKAANQPAIELAQTGKRPDGRYPLSTLQLN